MRYKLMRHGESQGYLIMDTAMDRETPWCENILGAVKSDMQDESSVINKRRLVVMEFDDYKLIRQIIEETGSLEAIKEKYPEYFV